MRRITKVYAAANSGDPVLLNFNNSVVGIGFVTQVTGTVNYTVNHTYDDLYDANVSPVWLPHGVANMIAATSTQESNYLVPISGVQVVINSGGGSVRLVLLQQGII